MGYRKGNSANIDSKSKEVFFYESPERLDARMEDLFLIFNDMSIPSLKKAILIQASFLSIHPFDDGNGRISRFLFWGIVNFKQQKLAVFLPLSMIYCASYGGFEIRLKDALNNDNWVPLIDYTRSFFQLAISEQQCSKRSADNAKINSKKNCLSESNFDFDWSHSLVSQFSAKLRKSKYFDNPYLSSGRGLYLGCLTSIYRKSPNIELLKEIEAEFDLLCTEFDAVPLNSSLYSGISGLGFIIKHLPVEADVNYASSILDDINEVLVTQVTNTKKPNIDIIKGLAGILLFASVKSPESQLAIDLREIALLKASTLLSDWLHADSSYTFIQGSNLGVAHGVPGLILAVSIMNERNHDDLVEGCFRKLLKLQKENRKLRFRNDCKDKASARLAWCYGGLGQLLLAVSVHKNGIEIDNDLTQMLDTIIVQYERDEHRMNDLGICHGRAGLVLILQHVIDSIELPSSTVSRMRKIVLREAELIKRQILSERSFYKHFKGKSIFDLSFLEGGCGVVMTLDYVNGFGKSPWFRILGV